MLGKRERSVVMPRTVSLSSIPPMAETAPAPKQARQQQQQQGGGDDESLAKANAKAAAFLAACGWCSKDLGPGKDAYIYRGEMAFCTHECRERQIKKDEQLEEDSLGEE